jgi:hypothetical protein
VKDLVHRAANCRALVVTAGGALVLHFSADTPLPHLTLSLRPQLSYQLWLPGLDDGWVA